MGLDPHVDLIGTTFNASFYEQFETRQAEDFRGQFNDLFRAFGNLVHRTTTRTSDPARFLAGLTYYLLSVIDAAWESGIRVFKPQSAFYEQLAIADKAVLAIVCNHLRELATQAQIYQVFDGKKGDIDSSQRPFYTTYLSSPNQDVLPGIGGVYDFDTMTVNTWMGQDVLAPGLPYFRNGKGAIVVTRSSNPSGTSQQDAFLTPSDAELTDKQKPFCYTVTQQQELVHGLGRMPRAYEVMLYLTAKFSRENNLDVDGVSPIFSVMGSTVQMDGGFREIRGNGAIALIPGFGHQGGNFKNIESLLVRDGSLAGHWGILSSSRALMYPWMKEYGGSGDWKNLRTDMHNAVDQFRAAEKKAYEAAGMDYPF
jgi:orotidine-5'-phosphate decarboxylase